MLVVEIKKNELIKRPISRYSRNKIRKFQKAFQLIEDERKGRKSKKVRFNNTLDLLFQYLPSQLKEEQFLTLRKRKTMQARISKKADRTIKSFQKKFQRMENRRAGKKARKVHYYNVLDILIELSIGGIKDV